MKTDTKVKLATAALYISAAATIGYFTLAWWDTIGAASDVLKAKIVTDS